MEINQIEQLLSQIEENARQKITRVGDVYILVDDAPKYRALLALKDFLNKNESIIRELNSLAKAAGVATSEIMASYAAPEIIQANNIQVGLGDPKIIPPAAGLGDSIVNQTINASDDLKKKSEDVVLGGSGAVVGEPIREEIIPDAPDKKLNGEGLNYVLHVEGVPDGVTIPKEKLPESKLQATSRVVPEGGFEQLGDWQNPPAPSAAPAKPKPIVMNDDEVRQAMELIGRDDSFGDTGFVPDSSVVPGKDQDLIVDHDHAPVPEVSPVLHNEARAMTDEEIEAAMANIGSLPVQGPSVSNANGQSHENNQALALGEAPQGNAPTEAAQETNDNKSKSKRRKVTSRRLHNWRNAVGRGLVIVGAIFFGENVTNRTESYRAINLKIGYLRSTLISGNAVNDDQVEELHNSIVSAADLTASEKKRLYKKLGRLDKAIERYKKREASNSGRKRGR